jgi:hypothetical protein
MFDLNNIPTVTKSEPANRQLCTAIRLFFDDAKNWGRGNFHPQAAARIARGDDTNIFPTA